jgi:catechol 2,3-dioxygenase-like lactoylglutathione lyase family enzyme
VPVLPIRFVDVNVTDLDRSIDFYTRHLELPVIDTEQLEGDQVWLDGGPVVIRLHRPAGAKPSRWIADDLQLGFRHFGFAVSNVDERAELLHEAGVRFHLEPLDATGNVRITFFFDPDGVLLEFIQGRLDHHEVWNSDIVDEVNARSLPDHPTFDHVAMTVRDHDTTVDFYRRTLGFDVGGRLFLKEDPRGFDISYLHGFDISYLHAGETVIELFTFADEKSPSPWSADETTIGFRHVGFDPDQSSGATDDDVADRLAGQGATPVAESPCRLMLDPDGFPLRIGDE